MGRIRTIKPEFWQDETLGQMTILARLTFIGIWNLCDDEGLFKLNALYIKGQLFPYDPLTKTDVENALGELLENSLIIPYKDAKNQDYGWVLNFRKHQRIDKPQKAKCPLPSIQNPKIKQAYAKRDEFVCHICGEEVSLTSNNRKEIGSLDHVKPKSKGGSDAPSNIKLAHFGCNASKKDSFQEDSENIPVILHEGKERKGKGKEGIGGEGILSGKPDDVSEKPIAENVIEIKSKQNSNDPIKFYPPLVIDYLNEKAGKHFQHTDANLKPIQARLAEGYTFDQLKSVVDLKVREWLKDPKFNKYLRPETLFNNTKFNGYIGQIGCYQPMTEMEKIDAWLNGEDVPDDPLIEDLIPETNGEVYEHERH